MAKIEGSASLIQILQSNYRGLFKMALTITGNMEHAAEVIQELIVAVLSKQPVFNNEAACKAYLYKAARNTAINMSKHENWSIPYGDQMTEVFSTQYGFSEGIERVEAAQWLHAYLDEYPETIQQAFIHYVCSPSLRRKLLRTKPPRTCKTAQPPI